MLDWLTGAVESAKTMKEIGQSLLTIRDENIIRERVYALNNNLLELQQKLLEAQISQMGLIQRIQELEAQVSNTNQSEQVMEKYTLKTFSTGASAYVLKTEGNAEPARYFCSNCLETKSLPVTLQGGRIKGCPSCQNRVITAPQPPITTRRIQRW